MIDISIIWVILFAITLFYDLQKGNKEHKRRVRIRRMRHRRGLH